MRLPPDTSRLFLDLNTRTGPQKPADRDVEGRPQPPRPLTQVAPVPRAVYSRNYVAYLEEATRIHRKDPLRRIVFRSTTAWIAAEQYPNNGYTIPIYYTVNGDDSGLVRYSRRWSPS